MPPEYKWALSLAKTLAFVCVGEVTINLHDCPPLTLTKILTGRMPTVPAASRGPLSKIIKSYAEANNFRVAQMSVGRNEFKVKVVQDSLDAHERDANPFKDRILSRVRDRPRRGR